MRPGPDDDHSRVFRDGVVRGGRDGGDTGLSVEQPEVDIDPVLLKPIKDLPGSAVVLDDEAAAEVTFLVCGAERIPLDHFKESVQDRLLHDISRCEPVRVAPEEWHGHTERVIGVEDGVTWNVDLLIVQDIPCWCPVDLLPFFKSSWDDQVFRMYGPSRTDLLIGCILHLVAPVLGAITLDRFHHRRDPGMDRLLSFPCVDADGSPGCSRTNRRKDRDPETIQGGDINDLGDTDLRHQRLNGGMSLIGRSITVCPVKVLFFYRANRDCHPVSLGGDTLIA